MSMMIVILCIMIVILCIMIVILCIMIVILCIMISSWKESDTSPEEKYTQNY